ncbi:MAG: hypothetical protein ABI954_00735 [Pyrinomonadaceae bacterium]
MAKKYDTNPLDEDVLRRAEKNRSVSQTEEISQAQTAIFEVDTRPFAPAPTAEMRTQTLPPFDPASVDEPYNSVFSRPQSFSSHTNPAHISSVSSEAQKLILPPTSRKVLGLGLPERIAMMLPYLPWIAGAIIAVVVLFCTSRTETRVRFHAAQALALHLASWIVYAVLSSLNGVLPLASLISRFFGIAVTVYFIVSLYRVWKGKPNHIEALDDVTDFLNEKIKPQSK